MGKLVKMAVMVAAVATIAYFAPVLAPQLLAAVGTTTATGLAIAVTSGFIVAAASTALMLTMNAVFPPPSAKRGEQAFQMTRAAVGLFNLIYGRRRVSGQIIFYHPKQVGSTHYRYFALCVAGHRCQGVVDWMLKDQVVTVDEVTGMVTSGPYANKAWLWFARGEDDQAANATFVAECDGYWTEDHRGRGAAMIYAKFEMTDEVVQAGMPLISAIVEGKDDIADPRDDSEGYTRNATLVTYDWMRLPRAEGGFGAAADEIPDDDLISAWANVCDEEVDDGHGGEEERYALDAAITVGGAPSQIRETLVNCQAGIYACVGGVYMLRPGYWNPPSHSLHEKDLVAGFTVPLLGDPQGIATQVSGSFVDPNSNYQPQPVPTRSIDSVDVVQADFDLPHVTSSARAQRILEIMLRRAQCEKKVSWPMNIAGFAVSALDTVQLDTARYGLSNYAFVVDGWGFASDFSVSLQLREENEDIYDDDIGLIDAVPPPDLAPPTTIPDPLPPGLPDAIETLEEVIERINSYDGTGPIP